VLFIGLLPGSYRARRGRQFASSRSATADQSQARVKGLPPAFRSAPIGGMSASPSSAPPAGRPPLAILYLPPILNLHAEDELAMVGRKFAVSLDKFATDNAAIYGCGSATVTVREQDEAVCRLTRRTGAEGRAEALADLFVVEYRPLLMARYRAAGLGRKIFLAAVGLVVMAWKGLWALWQNPFRVKRLRDRFQALYALAFFSLVFVYLALILVAGLKIVSTKLTGPEPPEPASPLATNSTPAPPVTIQPWLDFGSPLPPIVGHPGGPSSQLWFAAPGAGEPLSLGAVLPTWNTNGSLGGSVWQFPAGEPAEPAAGEWLGQWPAAVWSAATAPFRWLWELDAADTGLLFLALTLLGLAGGQGQENRLRSFINRASEEMLAFIYYLSFTDRRAEITGLVEARLEQVMESGPYQRYVVMGYSFGTVVALDAFCPASEVRARRLDRVDTLVTIASPYDFILTYWPKYFADRQYAPPLTWLNVYSPVDLLGTCFDKQKARAERTQRLRAAQPIPAQPSKDEPQNSFGLPDQLATGPTQEFAFREGVPDEQLGLFGWIAMQGLGAHSRYWAKGEDGERNCFDLLVPGLFPEEVAPVDDMKPLDKPAPVASLPVPGNQARQ